MVTKFGCEAWTPIPVEFWGNDYYAAARQGEIGKDVSPGGEFQYNAEKKQCPAEILVIASEDNTIVTILPNGRLIGPTQQPTVTLMKDEAYLVQSLSIQAGRASLSRTWAGHISPAASRSVSSAATAAHRFSMRSPAWVKTATRT
jgi:hypothetical protein